MSRQNPARLEDARQPIKLVISLRKQCRGHPGHVRLPKHEGRRGSRDGLQVGFKSHKAAFCCNIGGAIKGAHQESDPGQRQRQDEAAVVFSDKLSLAVRKDPGIGFSVQPSLDVIACDDPIVRHALMISAHARRAGTLRRSHPCIRSSLAKLPHVADQGRRACAICRRGQHTRAQTFVDEQTSGRENRVGLDRVRA